MKSPRSLYEKLFAISLSTHSNGLFNKHYGKRIATQFGNSESDCDTPSQLHQQHIRVAVASNWSSFLIIIIVAVVVIVRWAIEIESSNSNSLTSHSLENFINFDNLKLGGAAIILVCLLTFSHFSTCSLKIHKNSFFDKNEIYSSN